ncbi:MAG TPA: HEPN-associated N-terminal domain-containing protein [Chitinophagaceae bacterium]|nr:HEPN-associated N-terminal domain-containing protein [Chitinophagaceae bacterium]
MGFLKQQEIGRHDRGLAHPRDTKVCSHHIRDYAINRYIKTNGQRDKCSYCNKSRIVMELEDLAEFMSESISLFYSDAANWMFYQSSEGGYLGASTFSMDEILFEEFELDIDTYQLQDDLGSAFDQGIVWCERDPYELREDQGLTYEWDNFKETVKHSSRFLFKKPVKKIWDHYAKGPFDILEDVSRRINDLNLFYTVKAGTSIYRSRQHTKTESVGLLKDIVSPPTENAIQSNRMSPAGISMFYGAFDKETAERETIDDKSRIKGKDQLSTGLLQNKNELVLIDLCNIPDVPSIFDSERNQFYYTTRFLKQFVVDLSKDIERDDREHIEYVPTQIVTEYLRYAFEPKSKRQVDGIIYPSSKNKGGKTCVLFFDHKDSLKKMQLIRLSTEGL